MLQFSAEIIVIQQVKLKVNKVSHQVSLNSLQDNQVDSSGTALTAEIDMASKRMRIGAFGVLIKFIAGGILFNPYLMTYGAIIRKKYKNMNFLQTCCFSRTKRQITVQFRSRDVAMIKAQSYATGLQLYHEGHTAIF